MIYATATNGKTTNGKAGGGTSRNANGKATGKATGKVLCLGGPDAGYEADAAKGSFYAGDDGYVLVTFRRARDAQKVNFYVWTRMSRHKFEVLCESLGLFGVYPFPETVLTAAAGLARPLPLTRGR